MGSRNMQETSFQNAYAVCVQIRPTFLLIDEGYSTG